MTQKTCKFDSPSEEILFEGETYHCAACVRRGHPYFNRTSGTTVGWLPGMLVLNAPPGMDMTRWDDFSPMKIALTPEQEDQVKVFLGKMSWGPSPDGC